MSHYDVIVAGVGSMGSSTVYQLARRGARVLGLERFTVPHQMGSYGGVNRIIRLASREPPPYIPLLRRAYELWREIENISHENLLIITGSIEAGPEEGTVVKGAVRACEVHGLPHEKLDIAELKRRFPGYRSLPASMVAIYQPDGGFVRSERAVLAYMRMAQGLGAEVHCDEGVLSWEATGSCVHVVTNRGRYSADKLILTAGSWVPKLIPDLATVASPERQVMIWAQPLRPDYFCLGKFPIFSLDSPEGLFYGFPVYEVPGFKLGRDRHLYEQVDPDHMERNALPEDEELLREGIRKYFPDANGPTIALKTCLYTNTPDRHFILDVLPSSPRVLVAAGFSGHGFKFCSVIGEIMADLALNGETSHDLTLFRLGRFMS